jgi:pimeloyl-ACP methyl ester carboxylesterase
MEDYFISDGLRLRYLDVGDESKGDPVILVHGLGERIEGWKFQIEEFSKHFRVLALDLRGFGESEIPAEFIGAEDFARDIFNLMEHAEIKQAHLLGLSMGGIACLAFYKLYPEKVKSFILADTTAYFPEEFQGALAERLRLMDEMGMEGIAAAIAELSIHKDDPELKKLVRDIIAQNDLNFYRKVTVELAKADYRDLLPRINVPTLVIVGEFDVTTPPELSRYLAEKIPGAELKIVANSAHLAKLENPEEFNTHILDFLKRVA